VPPWFVVAVPHRGVSTAAAYGRLRLTRIQASSRLPPFRYTVSDPANDLERAVLPDRPDIGRLKECLLGAGAEMALMSGSGSAVFGAFASHRRARTAAARLPRSARAFVVRSLTAPTAALRRAGR
jgi:4-diphosphocytidyl-2-C-methyl-D-erythritol kinase